MPRGYAAVAALTGTFLLGMPEARAQDAEPLVEPYHGGPVPRGARLETRPDPTLMRCGGAFVGMAWLAGIAGGVALSLETATDRIERGSNLLFMPVAGPWLPMMYPQATEAYVLLTLDGIAQLVGVGVLLGAIFAPERVLISTARPSRATARRNRSWRVAGGVGMTGSSLAIWW